MHKPLLSIIIPVYNTEPWLRTCLNSMLASSFDKCEFIIVNDGSTDGSDIIINDFLCRDSRFKCISQDNKGLSIARNNGLDKANGQYILFVDSDDYIDFNSVKSMLDQAITESADVVVGRISCVDETGCRFKWGKELAPQIFLHGVSFLSSIFHEATYFPMVFGYLIRKGLIEEFNLSFSNGIIHEDELWTPIMLLHAQKTVVTEKCHYTYRTNRDGSIMSTHDSFERLFSISYIISQLINCYLSMLKTDKALAQALPFFNWRFGVLYAICAKLCHMDTSGITGLLKDYSFGHLLFFNQEVKKIL